MTSCITDFLCTLLMLISIRLLVPYYFINTVVTRIHLGCRCTKGGGSCDPSLQKLKRKDFIHTSWMWATVIWGQSPYSPQISDPIPPPLLPTPNPRVELIIILRLHSHHGQIKRKKRKGLLPIPLAASFIPCVPP